MNHKLLQLLRSQQGHWITVEAIQKTLGLQPRVVLEHIAKLRQQGYKIETTPAYGFRLVSQNIQLTSELLEHDLQTTRIGRKILVYKSTNSTNDVAWQYASETSSDNDGLAIFAESQRSGRGRFARKWFAGIGTGESTGTAVFALAGKIVNTGLVEVPMGTTLRQIIFEVGSGIPKGKRFKAVQIGGPSGGCLPESALDLPIDFDSLKDAGAMMGSGGMVVLDEDDCMVEIARYFLEFTQRESCGKCTFCRLGTKQMLEILNDFTLGQGKIEDLDMLNQLAEDVKAGSLCGLGKTAPNPVLTTLRYFRDEYEEHILMGRCPALMCMHLIAYYILPEKCERSCDACIGSCTVEAITPNKKRIKVIDQDKCVKCGTCLTACPPQYDAIVKLSPPGEVPQK